MFRFIPRRITSPEEAMTAKVRDSSEVEVGLSKFSSLEWINLWLQPLALGCIKISVLVFYSRVLTVHGSGELYWANGVLIVMTVA